MSVFGNIIWFVLGGEIMCLCYIIYGLLLCITIIGIPFGVQMFKIGIFAMFPFGKDIVDKERQASFLSVTFNIIYIIVGGWELALLHLTLGLLFSITIIGIPFGIQHFKLAKLALTPFGKEIVQNRVP